MFQGHAKTDRVKAWFISLSGTVALSLIALLPFLGRTFLDWRYVYGEFLVGDDPVALTTLVYLVFFGGWIWFHVERLPRRFAPRNDS